VLDDTEQRRVDDCLERARARARARSCLLFHVDGHPVTLRSGINAETLAALFAATFAAAREPGKLVSEGDATELRLLLGRDCFDIVKADAEVMLGTIYNLEETTHEEVSRCFAEAVKELATLLPKLHRREGGGSAGRGAVLRPGDPPRQPRPPRGRSDRPEGS
jgi:hypothetical protein